MAIGDDGNPMTVVVGHPRPGSRTHAVAVRAGDLLATRLRAGAAKPPPRPHLVDLALLAPFLLDGRTAGRAFEAMGPNRVVVMASPTFRGAYSGLLKVFLDLLPRHGLSGSVVVPLMTAGIPEHRHVVDTTLRPVLAELGADVPTPGISVLETDIGRVDEVFEAWWDANGRALRRAVGAALALREEATRC
ncbi:NADPH-dependent oxidoreductase [Solihabitans fulvus]|uniref:NADPH-dependent oxidoreductase n=1 Tax=Solihabitans fulvus TaxID=1892852 RepID=A0A5B2XPY1_9PSEU|nr:NAD(P)H-dependent oxidoreductase [Solihabitans fulvus]KAA2265797.1 NADPH-dependent oxidoreductase [Solihabitans fulvus]